jgi:hypothetical protein
MVERSIDGTTIVGRVFSMTKEFRRRVGFTNKGKMKEWLTAKDIVVPNYPLLQKYNSRLSTIFNNINQQLSIPFGGNIDEIIQRSYLIMKDNHIIERLNNNGRACEEVYYKWMQGYLAERVFMPFIVNQLNLSDVERNGSDDLTNPETFKRTGDADLIDKVANIRIDVQCGTGEGDATIKKHKFDHAAKNDGMTYIFLAGLLTGTYALVNLSDTKDIVFESNPSWEGALCWTVPETEFKPYYA